MLCFSADRVLALAILITLIAGFSCLAWEIETLAPKLIPVDLTNGIILPGPAPEATPTNQ